MTAYQEDLHKVAVPDLTPLSGSKLLVTGSTGLIGSCLVELLMLHAEEYGYQVYAGCRNTQQAKKRFGDIDGLQYVILDVTQPLTCDIRFDYIIDAASYGSPNFFAIDPIGVMKANLFGVCNLLDYGITHGLKRFLYISSGEVYGEGCMGKWTETDSGYVNTMTPRACYPSSKRAAETLCASYFAQHGIETVVARLCHTYGPHFTDKDNRVYAQFIRNVLRGENIVLKSKGDQYRSWLYVVDCASALIYILLKGTSGEAYNVADEESNITIRELAELVAGVAGKNVVYDLPSDIENVGATSITKAVFDTSKLKSLGWNTGWSIKVGIEHTIKSK